jgi:hypothetical protein
MSDLALDVPHVVLAPRLAAYSGTWWASCTCGAQATGGTPDEVRAALAPHRAAERERAGAVADRERDEARRRRKEARREQRRAKRSNVEGGRRR